MKIGVPSGVGDVSWIVSKLKHAGTFEYVVANGWPHRTVPYLELLPEVVASASYGDFQYDDILAFEQARGINGATRWSDIVDSGAGTFLLEPNRHLEEGKPLADWLPDLPTDYHYQMVTTERHRTRATKLLHGLPRPLWGISAASYRGSEAWKTWGYEQWSRFLKLFLAEAEGTIVLMGGFWDDLTSSLSSEDGYPDLVGKTDMGTAVEVLRHLDGYVGFSSGLGMLNTVDWGKTFLLWPEHQTPLSTSWADPDMLEQRTYMASLWLEPEEVFRRVRMWLKIPDHPERHRWR